MTVELAIVTPVVIAGFGLLIALMNIAATQGSGRLQVESAAEQIAHGRDPASVLKPLESLGETRSWSEQALSCVSVTGTHHVLGIIGFDIPMSLRACAVQAPAT